MKGVRNLGKAHCFLCLCLGIFFQFPPNTELLFPGKNNQKLGQGHDRGMWCFCVRNALKTKCLLENNPNSVSKIIPGQEDKPKNILNKSFSGKALFVFRHKQPCQTPIIWPPAHPTSQVLGTACVSRPSGGVWGSSINTGTAEEEKCPEDIGWELGALSHDWLFLSTVQD